MENPRKYGKPPFTVAVVHGGPGAAGEMAPVARELAREFGILEPLQTEATLDGQVGELERLLRDHADLPVTLIGYSWGAWLSFILAARHSTLVRKIILVGSGPFEAKYAPGIRATRLGRLSEVERREVDSLAEAIEDPTNPDRDAAFARFGHLFSKADSYDPLPESNDPVDIRPDIFEGVWKEAAELRRSGDLLGLAGCILCPVGAIHGDYDPHPAEGVEKPLAAALSDFRFILLERCGHKPWVERHARDRFYKILTRELL